MLGRKLERSPLGKLDRDLHLGLRRRLALLKYRIVRSESNCQGFCEGANVFIIRAASAIVLCGMQLVCRPQKLQLHHHMGKRQVDRQELAQCVCVHPQSHYTHQQLSQYNALLSRAYRIETKAVLRDQERCKPFLCWSSLFVYCLLLRTCVLFAENLALIVLISSGTNRKIRHNLCRMQYLIVASM